MVPRDPGGNLYLNADGTIDFTKGEGLAAYQAKWENKLFATPGPSSIQHMMLMDFVKNQLKLNFTSERGAGAVAWTPIGAASMKEQFEAGKIDGGIVWEPHYQNIIANGGGYEVLLTSEIKPDHACCVVAANRAYLNSHSGDVIRFLAGYLEAVNWMNDAIEAGIVDPADPDYMKLVDIAVNFTGQSVQVIKDSFETVKYTYEIGHLIDDLRELITTYSGLDLLSNSLKDIGFNNEGEFAEWLVNENYLDSAKKLALEEEVLTYSRVANIRIAILAADIHQLALQVAMNNDLGFLSKYNVRVTTNIFTVGGDVAMMVMSGNADLGFLGAPPVVLTSINNAWR